MKNIYLDGYPNPLNFDIEKVKEKLDLDRHLRHRLEGDNLVIHNEIINHPASVAVHIRRGDIKSRE